MPRKDVLAAGQKTAQFIGGVGDDDFSRNLSTEPRNEFVPEAAPAAKKRAFRPAGDVLLIRRVEAKMGNGIIEIADSVEKERPAEGVVLNIGPLVKSFKIGETVAFGKYAGQLLPINGEELLLAKEDEMLGTIEEIALDNVNEVGDDTNSGNCIR
jgi:chaperonin GroES